MSEFQASDHQVYFIYGANMNPAQMAVRCSNPEAIAVARLADYRLAFFGHSRVWDGGEETVIRRPGDEVWGVVFKLSFADADALDAWQDVRLDGSGSHFLCPAEVADTEGVRHRALLYKRDRCGEPCPPSEEYLGHLVAGAAAHMLPADYVARLRQIETRKAGYRVPKSDLSDRLYLISRACAGCG